MSKYKVVSHAERMQNENLSKLSADCFHSPKKTMIYKDVEIKDGNKILRDTRLVEYDPVENFKQYDIEMFDLQNLISIGAERTLKHCTFVNSNIDDVLSKLDSFE